MIITLGVIGIAIGFLSGFFGIGGGTILMPTLIFLGFNIKKAVGISIMQMMFSSFFGSYLNLKRKNIFLKDGITLGAGGFLGALGSGFFTSVVDEKILEIMFVAFVSFALYRTFRKNPFEARNIKVNNSFALFLTGVMAGIFCISIGVGGAVFVTPVLIAFFGYPLKKAASMGLFFVIFSSFSGFISFTFFGEINLFYGAVVGVFSLLGVAIGIKFAYLTSHLKYKWMLMGIYTIILILTVKKFFL
jgi:uncharacterized membrane protein YfcA